MRKIPVKVYKKPRKRFTSEGQIMAKIDDCHVRSRKKQTQAEAVDRQADEIFKKAANERDENERMKLAQYGSDLRLEGEKLRRAATRLIEVRAKKLGERLSEFRTELLPVNGVGDASVPHL